MIEGEVNIQVMPGALKLIKEIIDTGKKSCDVFNHDFKHLVRKGRADYRCPACGENVMLLLVFASEAGIDLTKDEFTKSVPRTGQKRKEKSKLKRKQ